MCIKEINVYLPEFPPITVDGDCPEALPNEELIDILEFRVPSSW